MLYVRCKAGISHSPYESVTVQDVAYGTQAFEQAVLNVAAHMTSRHDDNGTQEA